MWDGQWPLTKFKHQSKLIQGERQCSGKPGGTVSKIFSPSFWQLGGEEGNRYRGHVCGHSSEHISFPMEPATSGFDRGSWSCVPVSAKGCQLGLWVTRAEEAWALLLFACGEMVYCPVPFTEGVLWVGAVLDTWWTSPFLSSLRVYEVRGGAWPYSPGNGCFRELKSRVGTWPSS